MNPVDHEPFRTMTGLLVPVQEPLALLPQRAIAGWTRAWPHRKGFWITGAAVQGAVVAIRLPETE